MCRELINSGPDSGFLSITLLPPFKREAQKALWSVPASPRCLEVWAGMSWEMSQPQRDPHWQIGMERGSACMLHLTLLKVSKTFPKVLNFLFSTTHEPTDPWRAALIECSTSFSEVIFNHQHRRLLSQKPEGKCWFAEETSAGALAALSVHQAWMSFIGVWQTWHHGLASLKFSRSDVTWQGRFCS